MTNQNNQQGGGQRQSGQQQGQQSSGQAGDARQQQQYDAGEGGQFAAQIREHMDLIGADGGKVGKVDGVEGNRIKLVRADAADRHEFLPLGQVESIQGNAVRLRFNADEAKTWKTRD